MEQLLLPSTTGLALTSALIGALRVYTELIGSTAGSLCATLVDVCREAGRAGVSVPIALTGKPGQDCWGMDLPMLKGGARDCRLRANTEVGVQLDLRAV